MNKLPRRFYEARSYVGADVDRIFTDLDDQVKLSSHMSESSWTMGGGRMKVEFGEGHGRKVGHDPTHRQRLLPRTVRRRTCHRTRSAVPQSLGDDRQAKPRRNRFVSNGLRIIA